MLKNYLIIFLRNIIRQPVYAILNLACLAVGMAAAIFILLYLDFETNFDRNHRQAGQIYRINTSVVKTHERVMNVSWQTVPANLGPYIRQDCPQVNAFVRFFSFYSNEVRFESGQNSFPMQREHVTAADSNVFRVFSFDLLQGDPGNALKGPNKVVISETLAARIFPDADPVGKVLDVNLVHGIVTIQHKRRQGI